jgi:hypothetical protein
MTRLDEIIAAHPQHDQFLVSIFAIYTQASSRLARLLRDRRALSGEAAEGLAAAFKQALAEAGPILGIDLT